MENNTQKLETPVVLPRIFGPMMFPSICWRIIIKMTNQRHLIGDSIKIKIADGMAPINGPKNGMILVTPMITLIKAVFGIPKMEQTMAQMTPMIALSSNFPLKNPLNIRSA